ncbi:putative acyl-CoA hydrolase [Medicago truncatula]|uniref:Acyl-coenzyme A thioesterase 13 n=1 Tax=Medicago truncatula TaxID=3880 RepID=G7J2N9_MEDTR|nr:uncharacterized protein LOC11424379 [Medicago truncatula]AES72954.1 acyl-coenzyme A thioesterase-like protein [Medicago truncatula]RHN70034.1 putative acyl-CoA hydrolase [Medicago truncatula]
MLTKKSESGIMNIYCPLVIIDYEREHKLEGPSERAKQRNKNRMGKAEERTKLRSVKNYLEKRGKTASTLDALPPKFLEHLICHGLRLDLLQPGCIVFSMKIPPRLLNSGKYLQGGVIASLVDMVGGVAIPTGGVSVEINVSCLDAAYVHEEIEIEARVLRVGKVIAVVSMEFRKKKTGQVFAHGRHTTYLSITSKM